MAVGVRGMEGPFHGGAALHFGFVGAQNEVDVCPSGCCTPCFLLSPGSGPIQTPNPSSLSPKVHVIMGWLTVRPDFLLLTRV